MAGGQGVAGEAGADDAEPGLASWDDSASATVVGDHRNFPCFLSTNGPGIRVKACIWQSICDSSQMGSDTHNSQKIGLCRYLPAMWGMKADYAQNSAVPFWALCTERRAPGLDGSSGPE